MIDTLQKKKYPTPPNAVIPAPNHHKRSAFGVNHSAGKKASVFRGNCTALTCPRSLFAGTELVCLASVAEADVGFRSCVGSICGGLYARYIGLRGAPSNAKRLRRWVLLNLSVTTSYFFQRT